MNILGKFDDDSMKNLQVDKDKMSKGQGLRMVIFGSVKSQNMTERKNPTAAHFILVCQKLFGYHFFTTCYFELILNMVWYMVCVSVFMLQ